MNYFACFVELTKSRSSINVLLSLLIPAVIVLGFNQVASSWSYISTTNTDDCSLLTASLPFDYLVYPFRPNKNGSDKNHDRSAQNVTAVCHISKIYGPHILNSRLAYFISSYFNQFNYTCFLQDIPPPIFSR